MSTNKKPLSRKERLIKSLSLKKSNLEKKIAREKADWNQRHSEMKEQVEIINLQLKGLQK